MSYGLTDAGEKEMRAELKVIEKINEDVDQLSAEAVGLELAPRLKRALDLAWFIAEDALRDAGTSSCGHVLTLRDIIRTDVKRNYCACCDHYRKVGLSTQILRQHL